ncbi:hypothetical protein [Micromonospora costi]|uniref:hypothetical protein n=1 Tax=Micromonospora costi TaxID=1530042 RepID=UPI001F4DCA74|nr:hypothetical protein [Micromonospora costi]
MDGRRSFPDEQDPRWYTGERGRGYEPEWRGTDEARYRDDEFRAPEQRGATEETRYDTHPHREPGRFGGAEDDPGRFGALGAPADDRSESTGYRPTRARRAEADPLEDSGELTVERVGRRAARDDLAGPDPLALREPGPVDPAPPTPGAPFAPSAVPASSTPLTPGGAVIGGDPLAAGSSGPGAASGAPTTPGTTAHPGTPTHPGAAAHREPSAGAGVSGGVGDPARPAPLSGYPVVEATRPAEPPHPLEMPTGPMPPVGPRAEPPPGLPAYGGAPDPARAGGDGVYRTRRPVLAVFFAVLVLVFEVPALRLLAAGVTGDPVSATNVVSGTFLVAGLPIFAIGLYGLRTGGLSLAEGSRGWLRPPTAYLTVALALFLAAALAAG